MKTCRFTNGDSFNLEYELVLEKESFDKFLSHAIKLKTRKWQKNIPTPLRFLGSTGVVEVYNDNRHSHIKFIDGGKFPILTLNVSKDFPKATYREEMSLEYVDLKLVRKADTIMKNKLVMIKTLLEEFSGKISRKSNYKINFK